MRRTLNYARWLGGKAFALSCGIFIGAGLGTAIVGGSPIVLFSLISMLFAAPMKAGEADSTWLIVIEWKVALVYACLVAIIATPIWSVFVWKRKASAKAAVAIGFLLSFGVAELAFMHDDSIGMLHFIGRNALIGCAGAFAGFVVFVIDRVFKRYTA